MTPNQSAALDFIRERILSAGFSPTHKEIARRIGTSVGGAFYVVEGLVEQGLLQRRPGAVRGLRLPDAPELRFVDSELLRAELARRGEAAGAFARPERRAFRRGDVTCAADGCDIVVRRGHAFCLGHWRAISPQTQQALLGAHRLACQSREPTDAARYQEAFAAARDEISSCGGPF